MQLNISAPDWPEDASYLGTSEEETPSVSQSQRVPNVAYSPSDPRMAELWGREELAQRGALTLSAFFSGVCLISEAMGMLPLKVYRETKAGGWEYQDQHPTNYCFQNTVNGWQTPSVYKSMAQTHRIMSGNSVAYIRRNGRGQGIELKSFLPVNCRFYVKGDGTPKYSLRDAPYADSDSNLLMVDGTTAGAMYQWYDYDEVLHEKAFGTNGYTGLSTLSVARQSLDLTRTIESFGHKFFNKGRPAGFITKDGKLQPKQQDKIKEEWLEMQAGVNNAFNIGILSGGLRWEAIGYTNDDAQFLQSRDFQILEVARWLRIPPHLLAQLDKATNSNIEQLMLEFITHTMLPWIIRSEEEITLKMLTPREQSMGFKCFYDVDAFLRGDSKTRATVEEMDIRNGVRTIDEIRLGKRLMPYPDELGSKPLIIASQLGTLESVIDNTCALQGMGLPAVPAKKPAKKD